MRLTLRTLLAYMDEILEPEDREDLRTKIEHNEFASDLLHRSRDVMRRLRLAAPDVLDSQQGPDANSVAEYLDNTLPPEQVAEFERLCLESDVQLAEVASCHQILTMVLGEPATVRPEARARMYDIPAQADLLAMRVADGEDGPAPAELPRAAMPQIEVAAARPDSHVPDYLRQSFFERHGGKLALAAAILIGGLVYMFWPPSEAKLPPEVARRGDGDQAELPSVDEGSSSSGIEPNIDETIGDTDSALADAANDQDGELAVASPTVPGAANDATEAAASTEPVEDGVPPGLADSSEIPRLPPGLVAQAPADDEAPLDSPGTTIPEVDIRLPSEVSLPVGDEGAAPPLPTVEPGGAGALVETDTTPESNPSSSAVEGDAVEPASTQDTTATTSIVEPAEPALPEQVATYVSGGEMLLRYNEKTDAWMRLAPLSPLREGDQLLALPASRPFITLPASNLSVQMEPATRMILAAEDRGGLPNLGGGTTPAGLTVLYGRVVLFNPDQSGNWIAMRVRLGEADFGVELNGGASVALDVRRELPPGVDPLEQAGNLVADVFAISSSDDASEQVRWLGEEDAAQAIDTPAHWQVVGDRIGPVEPLLLEPGWIKWGSVSKLDGLAAKDVEPAIKTDQPARLSLVDLAASQIMRKREVKSLVTLASVHVGDFEPFVKALKDATQNQVWDEHIATLRSAMALDPRVAEQIREAFRNYKGQEAGNELFRLLWGYSKEQLENGALAELIEYLDHESLDFRVLAFNNLRKATGGKGLDYSPQDQPRQRQGPIREWRKRLMEGDLEIQPEGTG
jgi:hypothetical protein